MMRVLLLGGTGTLSTAICRLAVNKGIEVSVLNRGNNNSKLPKGVTIYKGNFHSKQDLLQCLEYGKYDVVIDFLSRIPSDIEHVYSIFSNNCQQFIFISSACVYRRAKEDFPIKETSPKPNKDWSYNIEKYNCEKKMIEKSKGSSSYYTIIRPYITYDKNRIPFGIAPAYKFHRTIIERIKHDKPLFVWNNGQTLTTLTYVEEFAEGVVGLFLNPKAVNQDFHITTDFTCQVKDVLLCLYKELGKSPNIINIPDKLLVKVMPNYKGMLYGDRKLDAVFDNSKIKDAVPGLRFTTDIHQGIHQILEHYKKSNDYLYDYQYEGQLDRMMNKFGIKTSFIKYQGSLKVSRYLYLLYRYFPYKIASRLNRIFKL